MEIPESTPPPENQPGEPVWTYRGYRMKSGEFVTAMVHFFRGEIQRANVWRSRLDTTTNWAVVATGATLSLAFSQAAHHAVILLNTLLVCLFLYMEARRYRYYELWSYRVRLMETDFYAAMLVPPFHPSPDWAESLAENLLHPSFPISMLEALGRRLRRNYFWMFLILGMAWFGKLWVHPEAATGVQQVIERAALGPIPGPTVLLAVLAACAGLVLLGLLTIRLQHATGEILPRFGASNVEGRTETLRSLGLRAWFRRGRKRPQYLAQVVTTRPEEVGKQIMGDLHRGVTALPGKGMYTGTDRSVLMCALTVTEIAQLKAAVAKSDREAFVIVIPAQEVFGSGFFPLEGD